MTDRINILGVGFDSLTMDEAVSRGMALMAEKKAAYVVTPNPEIVMLAREDPALLNAVRDAALVLPDGIGVVKGARILGTPLKEKIPGIDFATNLMAKMSESGQKLFLLGAKPGVAELADRLDEVLLPDPGEPVELDHRPRLDVDARKAGAERAKEARVVVVGERGVEPADDEG